MKEIELETIFESFNWNFDIKKEHINWMWDFVITAWLTDNWVLGKTDIKAKIFPKNTITIDMFWFAFFRNFQYKMVTHARVFSIKPKFKITEKQWLYLESTLHFLSKIFWYENMCSWAKIKNKTIILPTLNWKIDFDYMEQYIKFLEAERVEELEAERVEELEAYLLSTWLSDYKLTKKEKLALDKFAGGGMINFYNYKIWDLFEKVKVNSLKLKTSELPSIASDMFSLPALTAGIQNQGLNNFVPRENATILKNVISISANGANTGATFFQSKEFTVLQDAYAIRWKYNSFSPTNMQYLYLTSAVAKSIYWSYEWTNKAWWEKIKKESIVLPTINNQIYFEFMEDFISAIQKLVIKDVVIFTEEKMKAYKEVVWK